MEQEKKKRSPIKYVIEAVIYIAAIAFCVLWVPDHVIQRTVVHGKSMENTLHTGESLLMEKVSYHFTDPKRYDIIIFDPRNVDEDKYYVKRIYGLPGETVQIKDNQILINGEVITDEYQKDITEDPGIAGEPITLGEDEYFVLGDNRDASNDSRYAEVGPVKKEEIEGHVILRIWPLSEFGIP